METTDDGHGRSICLMRDIIYVFNHLLIKWSTNNNSMMKIGMNLHLLLLKSFFFQFLAHSKRPLNPRVSLQLVFWEVEEHFFISQKSLGKLFLFFEFF